MNILTEYRVANEIVDDDFPESFSEDQKIVLKKLISKELEENGTTFEDHFNIIKQILYSENIDLSDSRIKNIRKHYNIMKIVKDY